MELIITADDYGYSSIRDKGILRCYLEGVVTRASIFVNGSSSKTAMEAARAVAMPVGLHLNLTEGKPLTDIRCIVNPETGFFVGTDIFSCEYHLDEAELEKEISAQLEAFRLLADAPPNHVDGHNHIQTHPKICKIIAKCLAESNINRIRLPNEILFPKCTRMLFTDAKWKFLQSLQRHSKEAQEVYESFGVYSESAFFIGMCLMGKNMTLPNLNVCMLALPERGASSCELMCHPGDPCDPNDLNSGCGGGPDVFSCSSDRFYEQEFLCDPNTKEFLEYDMAVKLVSKAQCNTKCMGNSEVVAILSSLSRATGNLITARRLASMLRRRGYGVMLLDTYEVSDLTDFQNILDSRHVSVVIGINAKRVGEWLQILSSDVYTTILILGGTDINCYQERSLEENREVLRTIFHVSAVVAFNPSVREALCKFVADVTGEPDSESRIGQLRLEHIPQTIDIPNRIDEQSHSFLRKSLGISETDIMLLLCGGIRPVKDPLYLVDAIVEHNSHNIPNVHLVILGPMLDTKLSKKVIELTKTMNILHYHEPVSHNRVLDAMKEADMVVNTSQSEGMSNTIVEAMVARVPILARNNAGNVSLVKHKVTGMVFATPEQALSYVEELRSDSHLRESIVNQAFVYATSFLLDDEGDHYHDLIKSLRVRQHCAS